MLLLKMWNITPKSNLMSPPHQNFQNPELNSFEFWNHLLVLCILELPINGSLELGILCGSDFFLPHNQYEIYLPFICGSKLLHVAE